MGLVVLGILSFGAVVAVQASAKSEEALYSAVDITQARRGNDG